MSYSDNLEHIDVAEAAERLDELIENLLAGHRPYIFTENDQPRAVLLSYELYAELISFKNASADSDADKSAHESE